MSVKSLHSQHWPIAMHVFTATLGTETNSFSPLPTGLQAFEDMFLWPAGRHPDDGPQLTTAPLWIARQRTKTHDWTVIEGLCAYATPAGPVTRPVYERLRDELLGDLVKAGRIDAVLLGLHGAMIAEGYDDCEADLLSRIRDLTGPDVVIGAAIDLHANLSAEMLKAADVIISYKKYPHTDFLDRAEELADIVEAAVHKKARPVQAMASCKMAAPLFTSQPDVAAFVNKLHEAERAPGVLSISFIHGFPFSDSADMGAKLLVITDDDAALAQHIADTFAKEAFTLRETCVRSRLNIKEALAALPEKGEAPTLWADIADNSGAGAPNDSTFLLGAVLKAGLKDVALGPLWDPGAVRIAMEAGAGARIPLRIGGKTGPVSGDPVDVIATVSKVVRDMRQPYGDSLVPMGDCAAIQTHGVSVVLSSNRIQGYHPAFFEQLGIDPLSQRLLIVKSGQNFQAAFAPIAREIVYVTTPGALAPIASLPYKNIKRPLWPLDPPESCWPGASPETTKKA